LSSSEVEVESNTYNAQMTQNARKHINGEVEVAEKIDGVTNPHEEQESSLLTCIASATVAENSWSEFETRLSPCVRIVVASVFHSIRQGAEVRYE